MRLTTLFPSSVPARLTSTFRRAPLVQPVFRSALRVLSRNYILISGCQRSGTTMMLLLMDAHSMVKGLDESESGSRAHPTIRQLLNDVGVRQATCRKLPRASSDLHLLSKAYPHTRVVWMVRNPLAVVSSMRTLQLDGWRTNWLVRYAENEVERFSELFPNATRDVASLSPVERGARLWVLNCMSVEELRRAGVNVRVVKYEDVLRQPEDTMKSLFADLSLRWEPSVLEYHEREQNENRILAGATPGSREIDASRISPEVDLSSHEKEVVAAQCRPWASRYGYAL